MNCVARIAPHPPHKIIIVSTAALHTPFPSWVNFYRHLMSAPGPLLPGCAQIAAPQHLSLWAKPATLKGASERNQANKTYILHMRFTAARR